MKNNTVQILAAIIAVAIATAAFADGAATTPAKPATPEVKKAWSICSSSYSSTNSWNAVHGGATNAIAYIKAKLASSKGTNSVAKVEAPVVKAK